MKKLGLFLALISFLPGPALWACCAVCRTGFRGELIEEDKAVLLYSDGKRTHMVLSMAVGSGANLPKEVAWVIPVPSMPTQYSVASASVFKELDAAAPLPPVTYNSRPGVAAVRGDMARIVVHRTKTVGDYEIVPIEIKSEDSDAELNGWLGAHDFVTFERDRLAPYLKKGAAFLAVRVKALGKAERAKLKPLHLAYADPGGKARVPLRFLLHGPFSRIDVFLANSTEEPAFDAAAQGFGNVLQSVSGRLDPGSLKVRALVKLVGKGNNVIHRYLIAGEPAQDPEFSLASAK